MNRLPHKMTKMRNKKQKLSTIYFSAHNDFHFFTPLLPEKQLTNKIGERPRVHICTICYVHNFFVPLIVWFHSPQLIAVRGTLESLTDWAASYTPICFTSPFASLADFASQNAFNNSSKEGVLSSSMDATLGRLNDLFLGVEQDGSSTYHRVEILLKNKYMSGFLDDSSISTSITFEKKKKERKGFSH